MSLVNSSSVLVAASNFVIARAFGHLYNKMKMRCYCGTHIKLKQSKKKKKRVEKKMPTKEQTILILNLIQRDGKFNAY